MKKEWFSAKELVKIADLPTTPQAINQRARSEGWRTQRRLGVQGRAVEYHISSLPVEVSTALLAQTVPDDSTPSYISMEKAWVAIFAQLTEEERQYLISFVMREGINALLTKVRGNKELPHYKEEPSKN